MLVKVIMQTQRWLGPNVHTFFCREEVEGETKFQDAFCAASPTTSYLTRVEKCDKSPFKFVRSVWLSLLDDEHELCERSLWRMHQDLRRHCHRIASEEGTNMYISLCGSDHKIQGFIDALSVKRAIIQETIDFAYYCAEHVNPENLDCITVYTWGNQSSCVLMDFLEAFRKDFHGVLEREGYFDRYCAPQIEKLMYAMESSDLGDDISLMDLLSQLKTGANGRDISTICSQAGKYISEKPHADGDERVMCLPKGDSEESDNEQTDHGSQRKVVMQRCLDVLKVNEKKILYDHEMEAKDPDWIPLFSFYDYIRSLRALTIMISLCPKDEDAM